MQAIENIYKFMDDGIFTIRQHHKHPQDIVRLIEQLESTQALGYIHTVDVCIDVLFVHTDLWNALKGFIHKTTKVTHLSLNQHDAIKESSCNIDRIIEFLSEFKNAASIELILDDNEYRNWYSIDEMRTLNKYFDSQPHIKKLQLEARYEVIYDIMKSIKFNKSIETVHLTITNVEDVDEFTSVPVSSKITKISFVNCRIDPNSVRIFDPVSFVIGFNTFFERLLMSNPTITELELRAASINIDTVKIIANTIKTLDNLVTLSICLCSVDDEGIDILTRALETSGVKELFIYGNDIEYEGALRIAAMLKLNVHLKIVNLSCNPISYEGFVEILRALAANNTVSNFCWKNEVPIVGETTESITRTFEEILSDNYALTDFCARIKLHGIWSVNEIKLKNITDRNKEANDKLRFTKTKVAMHE